MDAMSIVLAPTTGGVKILANNCGWTNADFQRSLSIC
ncbi:hypothetical protein CMEL01_13410 [Colletotrichum melonis]|uniref:Uncharacterized protein n=2 Tax=Colletotrichum acutatum species complex TaxID=2707335 RepID=A0AAI9URF5_9PEZI|nr:uncharacterized protein CTAM01_07191 [Colletotrichum tamarilloi]KAK1463341.1 hypothetical protein CMEL01_13410 [Colletotrichum melonis]KAK1498462.1 hypothetical protein CTAM01_07191 [Colletotrichum tamarilloi]